MVKLTFVLLHSLYKFRVGWTGVEVILISVVAQCIVLNLMSVCKKKIKPVKIVRGWIFENLQPPPLVGGAGDEQQNRQQCTDLG